MGKVVSIKQLQAVKKQKSEIEIAIENKRQEVNKAQLEFEEEMQSIADRLRSTNTAGLRLLMALGVAAVHVLNARRAEEEIVKLELERPYTKQGRRARG